ncbi:MAG: YdcH family protein [Alphaproteobacteria bacterium]|nr:YdcH family protein [Alphaproteobacteria bacterium]
MTAEARLEALKERHATLETKIETEQRRPMPDEGLVHTLKREKLHLKDEISRLMH